jgi:hypothetical protein
VNVDQFFSDMRRKLRLAISTEAVAGTDIVDDCASALAEILNIDRDDFVEIVMLLEKEGPTIETVNDMVRSLDRREGE